MAQQGTELEFLPSAQNFDEESHTYTTPPSTTASYLQGSRFAWLLAEETVDDDEDNRPLLEELDIDLKDIFYKIRCVLVPIKINREVLLASPDFWGPMAVVLIYGLILVWGQFHAMSWVFTVWLFGSFIIFVLTRALGGDVSYSQTVGVIGYSLLPEVIMVFVLLFITTHPAASWILEIVGTLWSSFSAGSLLASPEIERKRILVMYPILLLYIYFISLHTGV